MSQPNHNPLSDSGSSLSTGFSTQSEMGLAEVLQMCCISRRSGQITFRSGESYGFVFIQQGRVLHAMCGTIEGEEAVYTMLIWPGGGFTLNEDILPHKKTITLTWEQLLFEGARRTDEGAGATPGVPVVTAEPVVSTRAHESQPKLVVTRPDLPEIAFELVQEYTHLGRAPGNEISLPYPSISSRHCVFVISGPDIVLRDLNSSNGTLVNGEPVSEVVLRPGDLIHAGVVEIKFEAAMKRPKLRSNTGPTLPKANELPQQAISTPHAHTTVKLPAARAQGASSVPKQNDTAYVKGVSAINYQDLAKPETNEKKAPWLLIFTVIVVALICVLSYFYFKH